MSPEGDRVTFLLGNLVVPFIQTFVVSSCWCVTRVQLMIKYYLNHKPRPQPTPPPFWQDYGYGGKVCVFFICFF